MISIGSRATALSLVAAVGVLVWGPGGQVYGVPAAHSSIDCSTGRVSCTEVQDPEEVFGEDSYVGHDEPAALFYSNEPGSGNRAQYQIRLPSDPPPVVAPGRSFNFQLHPAFWVGMAMCDTQSYPEQVSTCTPDSDTNIQEGANLPKHPGTAFMEMQFYPPGWVAWPPGNSCDAKLWCAALNVDSLAEDPINGTMLNSTCQSVTGLEYVNFAFITRDGKPQAPANPVQSTAATFTPDPQHDLFMSSGDELTVSMRDTVHGLRIDIWDVTAGTHGFMVASAANGFGQVKYAPDPSTECTNIPYDFHPMYSTSSEQTRVPWAAHSYNVAFSDEIGHFDYCAGSIDANGNCTGMEGVTGDQEAADSDDTGCFPASASTLIPLQGCLGSNDGFDGTPYKALWPDGNTSLHPTSFLFTSPTTGNGFADQYPREGLEADLPRIELTNPPVCNRNTGANCTLLPVTDDGAPADFYPFYSIGTVSGQCRWALGSDISGFTVNDFGKNSQYGSLLPLQYLVFGGGGSLLTRFNDFRQVFAANPCPSSGPA